MAAAGTMIVQFSDEDRAAIASAEDVIKRQDAKIAEIERIAVECLDGIRAKVEEFASAAADFGERLVEIEGNGRCDEATLRALGDRMTGLEKMLTGYVADLNALADRHSSYMMETRAMVERLDKISNAHDKGLDKGLDDLAERIASVERGIDRHDGQIGMVDSRIDDVVIASKQRDVALGQSVTRLEKATAGDQVELRGEVWRLIAPEIYEGLPRDIAAPIGAIIQGLSERVEELEARLAPVGEQNTAILFGRANEQEARIVNVERKLAATQCTYGQRISALEESRNIGVGIAGHQQSTIEALAGNVGREIADLRASVKVLGEDITAVGDRLGDHPTARRRGRDTECVPAVPVRSNTALEERLGNIEMRLDTIDNHIAQDTAAASAYVPEKAEYVAFDKAVSGIVGPNPDERPYRWRQTSGFDHGYLARAVEESVAEFGAKFVKRLKEIAHTADLDEVPF